MFTAIDHPAIACFDVQKMSHDVLPSARDQRIAPRHLNLQTHAPLLARERYVRVARSLRAAG